VSKSSNASLISWRCSSVISCRTLEWSREFEWSCDRDDEGVIALCWGDEDGRCAGRLRGLMALDEGYIFDMEEIA
jgi:hypothetical protein